MSLWLFGFPTHPGQGTLSHHCYHHGASDTDSQELNMNIFICTTSFCKLTSKQLCAWTHADEEYEKFLLMFTFKDYCEILTSD